jgi:uncharacterized protein
MRSGGVILVIIAVLSTSAVLARSAVDPAAEPFPLGAVRLLDGPFKAAQELDRRYLHELDPDRLLHTFRLNAGLLTTSQPLGGWEEPNCELRGHTLGHYLSACALMYAATGDAALRDRAAAIVAELARCQDALGDSGYLSAFPETWFDRVEAQQQVWAPYYTLHKIYIGLLDVHQHCENDQALAVVEKLAAWNQGRLGRLDDAAMQEMLNKTEQGGMNEAFTRLYTLTGNETYLQTAARFNQRTYVEPLLAGRDTMKGQHVNSFIPNIIGNAWQYEATGDRTHRHIAEYFWRQVVDHRSYATGGVSNHEHFRTGPDELAAELGDHTQETCCTYNMLKLTRHLFTWRPEVRYADYYERALVNSILSTQNPRTGMMMYFVPLATGRHKMFNLPNGSFWCCTGTGMENHARYGEAVYFHQGDRLYVNLFLATELDWQAKGVTIRQETAFPNADATTLTINTAQPTRIDLRVRVPYWAMQGVSLQINGEDLAAEPGADRYLAIDRTWKDGDTLAIRIPMSLHRHAMPDDPDLVAFLYGPLVLAGKLGGEGLTDENTHTAQNWYRFEGELPTVPNMQVTSDNINDWLQPVPGKPMTFQTTCLEDPVELVPYHQLFDQRYGVYWRVKR